MFKFSCSICDRSFYVSNTTDAIEVNSCPFCRRSNIVAKFDVAEVLSKYERIKLTKEVRAEKKRLENL